MYVYIYIYTHTYVRTYIHIIIVCYSSSGGHGWLSKSMVIIYLPTTGKYAAENT